jgi:protein-histidine pros-kinase
VLHLLLHYLILVPVKKVSAIAEAMSLGGENVEVYVKPGQDEISSLSISFNRMRESLRHAMDTMMDDLIEWQLTFRSRPLSLPA